MHCRIVMYIPSYPLALKRDPTMKRPSAGKGVTLTDATSNAGAVEGAAGDCARQTELPPNAAKRAAKLIQTLNTRMKRLRSQRLYPQNRTRLSNNRFGDYDGLGPQTAP